MSGFIDSDGSALAGALNPSNIGQALQVDALGNLKVTDRYSVEAIINGNAFMSTTGFQTGPNATNKTVAFSFFVPNTNTTKNIMLFSLLACGGQGSINHVRTVTTDPALGSIIIPTNLKIGGANSVLTSSISYADVDTAVAGGAEYQTIGVPSNTTVECLSHPILIPPSTNWGIVVYMFLANANSSWGITARHSEF